MMGRIVKGFAVDAFNKKPGAKPKRTQDIYINEKKKQFIKVTGKQNTYLPQSGITVSSL